MIMLIISIIIFSECCDNNISIIIDFMIFSLIILRIIYLFFDHRYNHINYNDNDNIIFII